MCWVDVSGPDFNPMRTRAPPDAAAAAAAAKELMAEVPEASPDRPVAPSKELPPLDIVEAQLRCFQRGADEDIDELWAFVAPNSELAEEHWSDGEGSTAPSMSAVEKFRSEIRREPRWESIAGRPCAALLYMREWKVLGVVMTDADRMIYRVRASPTFPDAPHAESEVAFNWHLVRRRAENPSAAAALGDLADCWMVHQIAPDYGAWAVADPLSADRAPDTFRPGGHKPIGGLPSERW